MMPATILAVAVFSLTMETPPEARPDFSGTWRLASQTTSAFRGRAAIGNHEEPVVIEQRDGLLVVIVQSSDPSGRYQYDLSGAPTLSQTSGGERLETVSRFQGKTLVTRGRRLFATPDGPRSFDFEESRQLLDGSRMRVETRIRMEWEDLRRTSVYLRTPAPRKPSR